MIPRGNGGSSKELVRLVTLDRKNGDEEFRVSVDEFSPEDGKKPSQYVSIRLWYRDQDREFRPSKTGCTVRRAELAKVLEALTRAERILTGKERIDSTKALPAQDDDRPGLF